VDPLYKDHYSRQGKNSLQSHIIEVSQIDFFFADPYCSWQRGANENLNGLIRQYFPKKTDFELITD